MYNQDVEYEWDEAKRQDNLRKHRGVDFMDMEAFDWTTAQERPSSRSDEARYVATGYIADRLHVAIYVMRGSTCRLISLRKANPRERRKYGNPD
jgi:uncharacterized DUF497 family protein